MSAEEPKSRAFSLHRWSQRKLAAARSEPREVAAPGIAAAPEPPPIANVAESPAGPTPAPVALPPVESLTIDSDFTAFLQPKVAESVKRQALKQLFRDPRFNVMDGLDVYVDDYSRPDPISPEVVKDLMQARYVFDPPQTRVNEDGVVEDIPGAGVAASDEPETVALPGGARARPDVAPALPDVALALPDVAPIDAATPATPPDAPIGSPPATPDSPPR